MNYLRFYLRLKSLKINRVLSKAVREEVFGIDKTYIALKLLGSEIVD